MGVAIHHTSGPLLRRWGSYQYSHLLGKGNVLFIDEIHRIPSLEGVSLPAMEDFFAIDIIFDKGPTRELTGRLEWFTLIGATTRPGLLFQTTSWSVSGYPD